jgi:hypothetical protein
MTKTNRETVRETGTAYAVAMALTNLLILMIVGSTGWLIHQAITRNEELARILAEGSLWR